MLLHRRVSSTNASACSIPRKEKEKALTEKALTDSHATSLAMPRAVNLGFHKRANLRNTSARYTPRTEEQEFPDHVIARLHGQEVSGQCPGQIGGSVQCPGQIGGQLPSQVKVRANR